MNWLGDQFMQARHAVRRNKHTRRKDGAWDAWFGREAEMHFMRNLSPMNMRALPASQSGSLLDGQEFAGVRLHSDAGQAATVCTLCYRGAPVRRLDLVAQTSEVIVDHPEALAIELKALAAQRLPITVSSSSFGFLEAMRPLKLEAPDDAPIEPAKIRTFDAADFAAKGLLSMERVGEHGWRIELTHAGREALAQFEAWAE